MTSPDPDHRDDPRKVIYLTMICLISAGGLGYALYIFSDTARVRAIIGVLVVAVCSALFASR